MRPQALILVAIATLGVSGGWAPGRSADAAADVMYDARLAEQLSLVEDIRAVIGRRDLSTAERSIELAKLASLAQARSTGTEVHTPQVSSVVADKPSLSLAELARMQHVGLSAEQVQGLHGLDALAEPVRTDLAMVLRSFLRFRAASIQALPHRDFAPVLLARSEMLDDVAQLYRDSSNGVTRVDGAPLLMLVIPGVACIDTVGVASTYVDDCAFSWDVGGGDTYNNNAGGASAGCQLLPAAVMLDFAGSDFYAETAHCSVALGMGVTGGGYAGSGVHVDLGGGTDSRSFTDGSGNGASSGSAVFGTGLLIDDGGADSFSSTGPSGSAAGAAEYGMGLLIDGSGDDAYSAPETESAMGSGAVSSRGLLIDAEGNDQYSGAGQFVNGSAAVGGVGFLYDGGGADSYVVGSTAIAGSGGGTAGALGFLYDDGGDSDSYVSSALNAANGAGSIGGFGALIDAGGSNDWYDDAGSPGTSHCSGYNMTCIPKPGIAGYGIQWDR